MTKITGVQRFKLDDKEVVVFLQRDKEPRFHGNPTASSIKRFMKVIRQLVQLPNAWKVYLFESCAGWGLGIVQGGAMTQIDQQWLDKNCYSVPADLKPELNKLADDAGRLADCEDRLIETIRDNKRNLERLPEIIRGFEAQLRGVSQELGDAIYRYDELCTARGLLLARQLKCHNQQQPAATDSTEFTRYCSACGKRFVHLSAVMVGDICPACGEGGISDIIAEVEAS